MNKQQISELYGEIFLLKAGIPVNETSIKYAAQNLTSCMSDEGTLWMDRETAYNKVVNAPLLKESIQQSTTTANNEGLIAEMDQKQKVELIKAIGKDAFSERLSKELRDKRMAAQDE
jgi:plastocyanin domain-containing protein